MLGLYIHFPFCLRKCGYCDFYSEEGRFDRITAFLSALEREWNRYSQKPDTLGGVVDTVYFGGGTPSLLEPDQVGRVLEWIRPFVSKTGPPEITIEANPATVSPPKLDGYLNAGINRISIGVQSFDNRFLELLGRLHSAEEAEQTVRQARRAGFENISVDLIHAIPGQTPSDWKRTLEKAVSLSPDHLSAYTLSWSYSTPLGKKIESGLLPKPDDDTAAEMWLLSSDVLCRAGFEQYEISNFARPGKRSRHNESYWTGKPYLGLGPSAHSLIGNKRFWNVYDVERYIGMLAQNRLPIEDQELLSPEDCKLERLAVGLRRKEGISVTELAIDVKKSSLLVANGLAQLHRDMLSLTTKGMLLADEIAVGLV